MKKEEKIKILKNYLKKLMELINFLETTKFSKKIQIEEIQKELIQDLRIDASNLEKLIELLESKKKKK